MHLSYNLLMYHSFSRDQFYSLSKLSNDYDSMIYFQFEFIIKKTENPKTDDLMKAFNSKRAFNIVKIIKALK